MRVLVLAALVTVACGPSLPAAGSAESVAEPPANIPASLACEQRPPLTGVVAPVPSPRAAPVAGQMTDAAAHAKRLFDREDYQAAARELAPVAAGQTGDDLGNQQLAGYQRAVALYRLRSFAESQQIFEAIAASPDHLKHSETLLWLAKFAGEFPAQFPLSSLATYTQEDVQRFNNTHQQTLFWRLSYLLGRARFEAGRTDEAAALFAQVPQASGYAPFATRCLALLPR